MKFSANDSDRIDAVPNKVPEAGPVPTVGVLGRDFHFVRSLVHCLTGSGFAVTVYPSAKVFARNCSSDSISCLVMDLTFSEMELAESGEALPDILSDLPVLLFSGDANPSAHGASVKSVAVHFFSKPAATHKMLGLLRLALVQSMNHARTEELVSLQQCFASLTPREMQILLHVIAGKLNKQIAAELGISLQTVKIHRMRITEKSGFLSVAELARAACLLGYQPAPPSNS